MCVTRQARDSFKGAALRLPADLPGPTNRGAGVLVAGMPADLTAKAVAPTGDG